MLLLGFWDFHHGRLRQKDLAIWQQDQAVLQHGFHGFRIGDELRGEIGVIELHPPDDIKDGYGRLRLLNREDVLVAGLIHSVRDQLADGSVIMGLDSLLGTTIQVALYVGRTGASGHVADAVREDDMGRDICGGCSIPTISPVFFAA
ncbi:hypothetical protein I2H36_12910 [Microvirga sp. BT290]|uniref:Uncharacterized protein n=1 Tax=Microvirga terrestris TaxID=2791024 RepID=A0ABS0HTX1_9HYPH|nr:hypothetical protein [Microvirga terrestris]